MAQKEKKLISIILQTYNEEETFLLIKKCMSQVVKDNPDYRWEFLYVNNGSTDKSQQQMCRLHQEDPEHYSYVNLSRNYGKEIAMMAGFDFVKGDAVIIMDSDMQHPVETIPEMLSYWDTGEYDDVYAQRKDSEESLFKRHTSMFYYRILQSMTDVDILKDTGDFLLLDRSCIEALKSFMEHEHNTKVFYSWIGVRKKGIYYSQKKRENGQTK